MTLSQSLQVPLREAIALGLDFEKALNSPVEGMVPMKTSQQVIIALKRFARSYTTQAAREPTTINPARGMQLTPAGIRSAMSQEDVSAILGTDMKGGDMDKSLGGIVRRVLLLLLALTGLGAGLFVVGLKFLFPDGM
jgi:hypothetical protein